MRVAIIPARAGSKRIPGKNTKDFCGKPMLAYAIDACRAFGSFDRVVVTTDSSATAELARSLGAEAPFLRSADLADDHTPTVPVVVDAIDRLELDDAAAVCCVYACVPFLRAHDLRAAHELLEPDTFVFPVIEFPSPIERALKRDGEGRTAPADRAFVGVRTQDLDPKYFDAGQFYWGHAGTWRRDVPIHEHARTIVVDRTAAVDIDTPDDWEFAEALKAVLER